MKIQVFVIGTIALWAAIVKAETPGGVRGGKVHGLGLCTERALVGTKETGHYVFPNTYGLGLELEAFRSETKQSKQSSLPNYTEPLMSLQPNETLKLRIGNFNIRAAFPGDRGRDCSHPFGWEARVDQVAEQINFYHPDIIGLQEDTHYQIKQLASYLPSYRYVGVNRDDCEESPDEAQSPLNPFGVTEYTGNCSASKEPSSLVHGGEFNSIWFDPQVVDLKSWGVFWLGSSTAVPGSHFLDYTCTLGNFSSTCDVGRIVTWAHFQTKARPREFFVFNTHVTSNQHGNRKSSETLIRKIKEIAGSSLVYAVGDFSTPQYSETYNVYRSYLNDPDNPHPGQPQARRQWPPEAEDDFRRGGRDDPPHGTFGPFVFSESDMYDFIWGRHITVLSILNDRLRNTTEEERRRLRSDHRMLLATVDLTLEDMPRDDIPTPDLTGSGASSSLPIAGELAIGVLMILSGVIVLF